MSTPLTAFKSGIYLPPLKAAGRKRGKCSFLLETLKNTCYIAQSAFSSLFFNCLGLTFESVCVYMHELICHTDRLKLSGPMSVSL